MSEELRSRRKRIALLLLAIACAGLVLFLASPPKSTLHDLGLLLMMVWLPVLSNFVVWFAKKRAPLVTLPQGFDPQAQRQPHVSVQAVFQTPPPCAAGSDGKLEYVGLALLGTEAFTLRLWSQDCTAQPWTTQTRLDLLGEFLNPGIALPRFAVGTQARLLAGRAEVAGSFETTAVHRSGGA